MYVSTEEVGMDMQKVTTETWAEQATVAAWKDASTAESHPRLYFLSEGIVKATFKNIPSGQFAAVDVNIQAPPGASYAALDWSILRLGFSSQYIVSMNFELKYLTWSHNNVVQAIFNVRIDGDSPTADWDGQFRIRAMFFSP